MTGPLRSESIDPRAIVHVYTDHNADRVRCFYEIPEELARRIQPTDDPRTFTQALADLAYGGER